MSSVERRAWSVEEKAKLSAIRYTLYAKYGFTLVELMISVVILGFGLVIVIQSFISALAGLDRSQNIVEAGRFAQDKITELTIASYENNGSSFGYESGNIKLGARQFEWETEITKIESPEYLTRNFTKAGVTLKWKERNRAKDFNLITYLPKKKEQEFDQLE